MVVGDLAEVEGAESAGTEPGVDEGKREMDGENCNELGVVRDSTEHEDMKDGNTADVDNEAGVLAEEVAKAVAVVGADVDGLREGEVLHFQMPRQVLQKDLVLWFAAAQKVM
jgi:hypothetical protein